MTATRGRLARAGRSEEGDLLPLADLQVEAAERGRSGQVPSGDQPADRQRGGGRQGAWRVLDGPLPLAYCLPRLAPRVVLSYAALQALSAEQVRAVLAHEQAHLRARHDLVLESFTAAYQPVPGPLRSRTRWSRWPSCWRWWPTTPPGHAVARSRWPRRCARWTPTAIWVRRLGPVGRAARRDDRFPQDDRRRRVGRLQGPATAKGTLKFALS